MSSRSEIPADSLGTIPHFGVLLSGSFSRILGTLWDHPFSLEAIPNPCEAGAPFLIPGLFSGHSQVSPGVGMELQGVPTPQIPLGAAPEPGSFLGLLGSFLGSLGSFLG